MFHRVTLVDMVHPLRARWQARGMSNVTFADLDVSGAIADALAGRAPANDSGRALPDVLDTLRPDFVISANILSQLPLTPLLLLDAEDDTALGRRLVQEHLDALQNLACPVCLITDTLRSDGESELDLLYGAALPAPPERSWIWDIAPCPEYEPDRDVRHEVAALMLSG